MEIQKEYRKGAIGALMDEYERATLELKRVIESVTDSEFERIVDKETSDESCRSIQTIAGHVVIAGYAYANYIREQFKISTTASQDGLLSRSQSLIKLNEILTYTEQTLEGRWLMSEQAISSIVIKTRWGVTYDLEQLLEHAIVHILRHRRQIEKFIAQQRNMAES
ncbi:MAG: DinB family protein [Acidobacteriota bacterium]